MVRPTTRNIGNDLIGYATAQLLYEVFGSTTNVISIPALTGPQFGGMVARQVYDMNRLADAVVVGGGNLFENGQLSYDAQAVRALRRPLMLMGLSHGRIGARDGQLEERTDALNPAAIRHLVEKSAVAMVRDVASQDILRELGATVGVGGCPTLFLAPAPRRETARSGVFISVRHPMRMSVPPQLQWRIADDVRRMIAALGSEYGQPVQLVCHDYIDLEFAAGFAGAVPAYFDDVERYLGALRNCAMHVSYRLHGFLPCLAMGSHSINLSYDERGSAMLSTIGMAEWDIDLLREPDCVGAVMDRVRAGARYQALREAAMPGIAALRGVTLEGLQTLRALAAESSVDGRPA